MKNKIMKLPKVYHFDKDGLEYWHKDGSAYHGMPGRYFCLSCANWCDVKYYPSRDWEVCDYEIESACCRSCFSYHHRNITKRRRYQIVKQYKELLRE